MTIQYNTGNVGIGTTGPRVLLDLAKANNVGQVILLGETAANNRVGFGLDSATAGMRLFTVNDSGQFFDFGGISTSDGSTFTRNHRLGVAGGNSWLNEQGGNVGIGTTGPGFIDGFNAGLHMYGQYPALRWETSQTGTQEFQWGIRNGGNFVLTGEGAADLNYIIDIDKTTGGVAIGDAYTGTAKLYINGNVGIGTTGPTGKVDIIGTMPATLGYSPLMIYDDRAQASNVGGGIGFGGKYTDAGDYTNWAAISGVKENGISGQYQGSLAFYTRTLSEHLEKMRITSSGNVGIGTTTPSKQLVVNGTTEGIMFEPNVASPVINTTTSASNSNLTITSSSGSVIIRLG